MWRTTFRKILLFSLLAAFSFGHDSPCVAIDETGSLSGSGSLSTSTDSIAGADVATEWPEDDDAVTLAPTPSPEVVGSLVSVLSRSIKPSENEVISPQEMSLVEPTAYSPRTFEEAGVDDHTSFDFPQIREDGDVYRVTSMLQDDIPQPEVERRSRRREASTISFDVSSVLPEESFRARLSQVADVVGQGQSKATQPVTAADLVRQSGSGQTTKVRRRSSVSVEPYIRGYRAGQIYTTANGAYWTPVRRDLDTMLSSIDPTMIESIAVVPGPYGLRYGPGLAFIDVVRAPTPRSDHGFENQFDTIGNVRTNGGQVYGRATAQGGGKDWGYRFSYGHRRGNDYQAGNGLDIPSSYENRDVFGDIGFDLSPNQHIEFSYQRLDQTDTEFPVQFFDINALTTYGFGLRYFEDDPTKSWDFFEIAGWCNRTTYDGDNFRKYDRPDYPTIQRVNWALAAEYPGVDPDDVRVLGQTEGSVGSSGVRTQVTYGDPDDRQLRAGADLRYIENVLIEDFEVTGVPDSELHQFSTNLPHSWMVDPGIYVEGSAMMTHRWKALAGARVDWASTRARFSDVNCSRTNFLCRADDFERSDVLYAFYQTNEFMLTKHTTLSAGFGHSQRPPSLLERYSDGIFVSLAQSGFTRVVGEPTLDPERSWQIDVGIDVDRPYWRTGGKFFSAWVHDYITVEDGAVQALPDARLLRFTNTEYATLIGFEGNTEIDLTTKLSAFGVISYVEGIDREIDRFLWAIPPLDSIVGLRLHDASEQRRWAIEMGARIVADMERLGAIRGGTDITMLETRTPGFTVCHLRGYWSRHENLRLTAGIENLFDRNYLEHLDMRFAAQPGTPFTSPTLALAPGFTPYFGVEWIF